MTSLPRAQVGTERNHQFEQLIAEFRTQMQQTAAETDSLRVKLASKVAADGKVSKSAAEANLMVESARRELKALKSDNHRLQKTVRERAVCDALRWVPTLPFPPSCGISPLHCRHRDVQYDRRSWSGPA